MTFISKKTSKVKNWQVVHVKKNDVSVFKNNYYLINKINKKLNNNSEYLIKIHKIKH